VSIKKQIFDTLSVNKRRKYNNKIAFSGVQKTTTLHHVETRERLKLMRTALIEL